MAEGVALGYRRGANNSSWFARFYAGEKRYKVVALGQADDHVEANGETMLTYWQAAQKAREQLALWNRRRDIGAKDEIKVGDAADHYLKWFRQHRRAIATTERIVKAFILPAFGDKLVAELRKGAIASWHRDLAAAPARKRTGIGRAQAFRPAPATEDQKRARRATANRTLGVLKAILNRAAEDELIPSRGAWIDVKPFPLVDQSVERFLSSAEAERLLNACAPDYRALVRAALLTGARYAELAELRVADVTLEGATGRIFIRQAKSGRRRHVPLSAEGRALFAELAIGKTGNDFVFVKANDTPWGRNHQVRPLQAACARAKIEPPVTFHQLRHSYASLLAQAGADLLTISKLLGHADTRITARYYAHLCDRTLAATVEKLLPDFGASSDKNVVAIR